MIEVFDIPSDDLDSDLAARVHALLSNTWPEDARNEGDYYRTHGAPTASVIAREGADVLAHLAVYQREVGLGDETLTIGMLGGIVVAPEHRRRGHSRLLVRHAHNWLKARRIPFSVLFTHEPRLYTSSGYKLMQNTARFIDIDGSSKTSADIGAMYAELAQRRWPNQTLDLRGRTV